ncbi:hypothetical protein AHAS_Ahas07G0159700 [Arachis hypogaea]|uniref:Uncharacterized protein n=1 Tax=Arachis hypogaea TaxID=3818 RepID=A0A445CHN0_ARAHY|nr:hypothetical protein Ahy_A07g037044 [Arachis hypogaea]
MEVNHGRMLQISGDRHVDDNSDDDKNKKMIKWNRIELCYGKFQRRCRLSENTKVKQVMENGVFVGAFEYNKNKNILML